MIIVVGAGLAGLTCAKELIAQGQQVLILEQADRAGGRVRTDIHDDGYRLDRGFQVLFTAYPAVQRHLDLDALKQRKFEPGALLVKAGKRYEIADPLREPNRLVKGVLNPLISPADKLRVLRLRQEVIGLSAGEIFSGKGQPDGKDESSESYLRRLGFAEEGFISNFARPFYGGIYLDRSLSTSARLLQFTFKMLAKGDIIVPAEGMQSIAEQLVNGLPEGTLRCNTRVHSLQINNGRVEGVRLASGETLKAASVVIATESPIAEKWLGSKLPTQPRSSICLYFAGDTRLYNQKKILLNTAPDAYVNNAVLLTNIVPTYAPPHKHLLSATILNETETDDELVARKALTEMRNWFPESNLDSWKFMGIYRIPFSQFEQAPGVYETLPGNTTGIEGLYLAGEYTQSSSIQGAMHSGEHAAKAILRVPAGAAS
ncbi:MAG TPA: NAD(P)/FAD-dependent oxidoreductase [Ktedonobacteraceae bacterium]|nr:NAD(P)/FAD-dependent oxidoreductase [Ktedonobacteraceae bacterium]